MSFKKDTLHRALIQHATDLGWEYQVNFLTHPSIKDFTEKRELTEKRAADIFSDTNIYLIRITGEDGEAHQLVR